MFYVWCRIWLFFGYIDWTGVKKKRLDYIANGLNGENFPSKFQDNILLQPNIVRGNIRLFVNLQMNLTKEFTVFLLFSLLLIKQFLLFDFFIYHWMYTIICHFDQENKN